jgi:hypothetical protein
MTREDIHKCMKNFKSKTIEGFGRIPQKITINGIYQLLSLFTQLFDLVNTLCKIPEQ